MQSKEMPTRTNSLAAGATILRSAAPSGCFLDAAAAAVFLGGMNSRTLTRWAREGYIPAYPLGEGKRRLWRFLQDDLEQWMRSRQTGTLGAAIGAPVREGH